MAKKKAELEADRDEYVRKFNDAQAAIQKGDYHGALEHAVACWEHVDGMIQYERRYSDREFKSVGAIDLVLKYAPALFEFEILDTLERLLKDDRQIERRTSVNLGEMLANARARMQNARTAWNYLEEFGGIYQDKMRKSFGGDQSAWRQLADDWDELGVAKRTKDDSGAYIKLATKLDEEISAKCWGCGAVHRRLKVDCLQPGQCQFCHGLHWFVILEGAPCAEGGI